MENCLNRGQLIWYSEKEGCGILREESNQQELFLRRQECLQSFGPSPVAGQRITYRAEFCDKLGRHYADQWQIID